ncbi:MAG: hypothetical protein LBU62_03305 [Bacteroidales bacterium]|jgi:hypothetical protein|nr:hypothetical protein [Bacteroidales bacterium]
MKESVKRFLIRSLMILFLLEILAWAFCSLMFNVYDFPGRIVSMLIVWVVTVGFHYWLLKVVDKNPRSFNWVYMMQTGVKLFLYIICVFVYLLSFREFARQFVVVFLITYIVFAVFEVVSMLNFIKNKAGSSEKMSKD